MSAPRTPTEPQYEPGKVYPGRDAEDLADLAQYLEAVAETYREAARLAASSDEDRLQKVARNVTRGRKQAENVQRLVGEWAMHQGLTLREAGRLFPVSHTTTYQWRFSPLSADDLT